jgi:ABC-type multidrug transport system permease subunit
VSLIAIAIWGALTMTGVAMLIAARPRSTEVAAGWGNLFMLPMWLLGGSFFSYERFPDVAQPFIQALPLTALNDALRAVVNDGASLLSTWPQLAVLGAWGGIAFVLSLRIFRWQ